MGAKTAEKLFFRACIKIVLQLFECKVNDVVMV